MMLNELRDEIYQNAVDKGLYKNNLSILESLAHVTSEVGEAVKAVMTDNYCNEDLIQLYHDNPCKKTFQRFIKDTLEDEIADSIIRLFSLAGDCGIDLDFHVREKMKFNKTR